MGLEPGLSEVIDELKAIKREIQTFKVKYQGDMMDIKRMMGQFENDEEKA